MNRDADIARVLEHWLEDGPDAMPDRVEVAVADRIHRQRQRPSWHLIWRDITMHTYAKVLVGGAAVLIVAVVGYALGSTTSGNVGDTAPTPAPTVAPTPVVTPVPTAAPSSPPPLADPPAASITGSIPDGWLIRSGSNYNGTPMTSLAFHTLIDDPGMYVELLPNRRVMAASCEYEPEPDVDMSADAIVGALSSRPGMIVSEPLAVTVGGLTGQQVDIQRSPGAGSCPSDGEPWAPILGHFAGDEWQFTGVVGDEHIRLIVLEASGGRNVAIQINATDGAAFEQYIADAMSIVESLQFDADE